MWVLSGGQGRKRAFSAPGRECEQQMICCLPEKEEREKGRRRGRRGVRGRRGEREGGK